MANQVLKPRFRLGQVVMTAGVKEHCGQLEFDQFCKQSLNRHMIGDWGDVDQFWKQSLNRHALCDWGNLCPQDKQGNDMSLKNGFRLVSAYESPNLPKIWIITEGDRSVTTILFPDEY